MPEYYIYDSNGRLTTVSALIYKTIDGTRHVVMHPTKLYIWGPDRVLAQIDILSGNTYYYLYNGHGDVVQIVDTNGNVVNSYDYDVWGNFLKKEETIENHFTYLGQTYDEETGLYYLRARYYDPTTGRFTQQDPAEDGYNWYVYGANNPITYIDPTGLSEQGDDALGMNLWYIGWMSYYTEKYNEVKNDTRLSNKQKYIRMNSYRRCAVEIRKKYNSSYVDNYDYTYGGIFDESSLTLADMLEMNLTQKEWDDMIDSTIAMGLKSDIKQINQVAAKMGITGAARREFGDYIESIKKASGKYNNTNFSWKELVELAKEFLGE